MLRHRKAAGYSVRALQLAALVGYLVHGNVRGWEIHAFWPEVLAFGAIIGLDLFLALCISFEEDD